MDIIGFQSNAGNTLACIPSASRKEMDLKTLRTVAALRALRAQSLWRLLAADKAPVILTLLQTLLLDNEKVLSSSVLK
jgi:hypothetical protein